jgi:hypothetical protein
MASGRQRVAPVALELAQRTLDAVSLSMSALRRKPRDDGLSGEVATVRGSKSIAWLDGPARSSGRKPNVKFWR